MNQFDLLFLVLITIGLTSIVVVVVQFVRSRRRGPDDSGSSGNWWEGPWDEDDRR